MKLRLLVPLIALLIGGAYLGFGRAPAPAEVPDVPEAETSVSAPANASNRVVVPSTTPTNTVADRPDAMTRALQQGSLRGTEADGAYHRNPQGRLVYDRDLRRRFDYYLSAVGEATPLAIRQWLVGELQRDTPPELMAEILAAFDRYIAYLAAIDQTARQLQSADADARDQILRQLRRQYLGNDLAQAFFAEEEAYADYRKAERALAADTQLDPQSRAARAAALLAALPEALRDAVVAQNRVDGDLNALNAISELEDPQARAAAQTQAFGAETAARLVALEQEQSLWQAQLLADARERERLRADTRLSADERATQLAAWRAAHLAPEERQRIEALEAAGVLDGSGG